MAIALQAINHWKGEKWCMGQLKLRQVYDLFVQRFPAVAAVISFDTFSIWVDEALEQMREMLAKNEHAAAYVENCFLVQEIREGVAIDG